MAVSQESDVSYPVLADREQMARFDLRMTYRLDSDVPLPYLRPLPGIPALHEAEPVLRSAERAAAGAPAAAVYIASNPVPWRDDYVRELMAHLPVHALGECLRNHRVQALGTRHETHVVPGYGGKLDVLRRYPFTLAFENSATRDYVTEKAYHPLACGSIPVIRGAPNAAELMPHPDAAIYADEFASPAALGAHLRALAQDPERLAKHHAWRRAPATPAFERLHRMASIPAQARLAIKLLHGCDRPCPCGRDPAAAGLRVSDVSFVPGPM